MGQTLRLTPRWLLSLDFVLPRDSVLYPSAGTEFSIPTGDDRFEGFLRLGWSGRTNTGDLDGMTGFAIGLGLGYESFTFDYAWLPYGVLGTTSRMTLSYRF
ncbi:MAG: hypothetical protein ABIF28_18615 [Pseudomonadota bacterium]